MEYQDLTKEQLIEICQHFDTSLETIASRLNHAIVSRFGEEHEWEPSDIQSFGTPDWNTVAEMREEANSCLHFIHDGAIFRP